MWSISNMKLLAYTSTSASVSACVGCDVMTAEGLRSLHWEDIEPLSVGSLWVSGPHLRNPRGFSAVCLQCSCLYSALHSSFFSLCLLSEEVHWRLNVFWMEDLKETFNPWRPCKHLIFITPSAHGCRGPFPRDEGAAEIGGLLDVTNTFVSSVLAFPWFKFFPSFWVKEFPICNQDNILGYFQHCTWVRAPGHLISLLCILLCSIFKI